MNILHSVIVGKRGEDLIILHGFLGMGDNWKTYANGLSVLGYRVHLIDQRNHGKSFWSNDFSYSIMAEDIVAYCKTHSLEKILVLGHSMGGKTAMYLACYHSELIKAFIIADIAPKKYQPRHQKILNGLSQLDFGQITSRAIAEQQLSNWVKDASTRKFLLKNLYWLEPGKLGLRINIDVLKNVSEAIGLGLDSEAKSDVPCLFLKGENSDYILDSDGPIIKYHFPNSSQASIPKVGHWLHAESPKEFFKITSHWLSNNINF